MPLARFKDEVDAPATVDQKFDEFHAENPHVYRELVRLCRQARKGGRKHVGIRMLWEVTRWNFLISTTDANSDFKLNDHYTSRYARLIMQTESDLRDIFHVRDAR